MADGRTKPLAKIEAGDRAEGTCAHGVIRISNTDPEIVSHIVAARDELEFSYVIEDLQRPNGMKNVRLLGGLRERLAFLHTVDPASHGNARSRH